MTSAEDDVIRFDLNISSNVCLKYARQESALDMCCCTPTTSSTAATVVTKHPFYRAAHTFKDVLLSHRTCVLW